MLVVSIFVQVVVESVVMGSFVLMVLFRSSVLLASIMFVTAKIHSLTYHCNTKLSHSRKAVVLLQDNRRMRVECTFKNRIQLAEEICSAHRVVALPLMKLNSQ